VSGPGRAGERGRIRRLAEPSSSPPSPSPSPSQQAAPGDELPSLATIDVSFISLAKVLGPVVGCLSGRHDVLALVKPQFEVGRGRVGKGGVVRDAGQRRAALVAVGEAAVALGEVVLGYHSSGLPGPKGNRETFAHLAARSGEARPQGTEELERMALAAEPA
jgi:23S rRNA (cytidine1920-2'-O)/16S rRNA (cytidine1409-2'-O)-methyltransferase